VVDLKFDFGLTHSTFISTLTQSTSTSKNTPWSILDLQNLLSIVVDNSSFHFGGFFFWLFCHSREDFDSFVLVTCSRSLHMVNFCVHAPPYCVKHCTNDALFIQEWTYDKESHQCFSEPTMLISQIHAFQFRWNTEGTRNHAPGIWDPDRKQIFNHK